jgi:uncharacterized membrane protein YbhN (UPF0104 family)
VHAAELLRQLPGYGRTTLALACTAASFLVLGAIELLAFRYAGVGAAIPRRTALTTAFVANAFSQTVGLPLLTGPAVRLRAYVRYRVDALTVAHLSVFVTLTVTLGLIAGGAGAFLASRQPLLLAGTSLPVRPIGVLLALIVAAYLAWSVFATHDSIGRWRLRRPTARVAAGQLALSIVDWLLTGSVLFALLPPAAGIGYWELLRVFFVGQTVGVASQIPGAAGVFEVLVLTLSARGDASERAALAAALVMFRVVYYLVPLIVALVVAGLAELLPGSVPTEGAATAAAASGVERHVG